MAKPKKKRAPSAPPAAGFEMAPVGDVVKQLESAGLGFERVGLQKGASYKDSSTIIIIPTRGTINHKVINSWINMIAPMNQKRAILFAVGDEVGIAYDTLIKQILADPNLSTWKYILTLEDDNIQPPDAHIRLLESIEEHKFDAVSGIYWTKGEVQRPMAYGDPVEYARTGVLTFEPLNIATALARGQIVEVNGIAMGCSLYRMELFKELPAPWFQTMADVTPTGIQAYTQDLFFCKNAKARGKRFAVDMRVRVGHLDINTNTVY